jgi:hypothetical protein
VASRSSTATTPRLHSKSESNSDSDAETRKSSIDHVGPGLSVNAT